jgi:hypothetical protein
MSESNEANEAKVVYQLEGNGEIHEWTPPRKLDSGQIQDVIRDIAGAAQSQLVEEAMNLLTSNPAFASHGLAKSDAELLAYAIGQRYTRILAKVADEVAQRDQDKKT